MAGDGAYIYDTQGKRFLDAVGGSLGGVENQVGDQVHADTASYLLRQTSRIDDPLSPHIAGNSLQIDLLIAQVIMN